MNIRTSTSPMLSFHGWLLLLLPLLLFSLSACRRIQNERFVEVRDDEDNGLAVDVQLPDTLVVGTPSPMTIRLWENDMPVAGASVEVEGNMSHAGMEPVFVDVEEVGAGVYQAEISWTMSGEWFITVRAILPDGRSVEHSVDNLDVQLQ